MAKTEITLTFEEEKLDALEFCLRKENSTVKKRMDEALQDLYEQSVPGPVREYLDSKAALTSRSRRPSKPKPAPTTSISATVPREDGVTHEQENAHPVSGRAVV